MSTIIRNENELATLRCGLRLESRRWFMATRPFLGAKVLGPELLTPVKEMGFVSGTPERGMLGGIPGRLPEGVLQQVEKLDAEAAPGAPLWLQVERDAQMAAVFPWETLLAGRFGRSVLRIPNFLENPWSPRAHVSLAICASAPVAKGASYKGAPDLNAGVVRLLTALTESAVFMTPLLEITLFTGAEVYADLRNVADRFRRPGVSISVPDPQETTDLVEQPRKTTLSGTPSQSPWLAWLARYYAGIGVDAVHFLCPGYAAGSRSALALAESPLRNQDTAWARFVEVAELAAFYDRLGCAIMGFTPMGAPVWAEAVRTLAYQLAWMRPGPILIDDKSGSQNALSALWKMLLEGNGMRPGMLLALTCYLHPSLALSSDNIEDVRAPNPWGEKLAYFVAPNRHHELYRGGFAAQPPAETLTERMLEAHRTSLSAAAPRSSLDEARDRGTSAALDFLNKVMKQ